MASPATLKVQAHATPRSRSRARRVDLPPAQSCGSFNPVQVVPAWLTLPLGVSLPLRVCRSHRLSLSSLTGRPTKTEPSRRPRSARHTSSQRASVSRETRAWPPDWRRVCARTVGGWRTSSGTRGRRQQRAWNLPTSRLRLRARRAGGPRAREEQREEGERSSRCSSWTTTAHWRWPSTGDRHWTPDADATRRFAPERRRQQSRSSHDRGTTKDRMRRLTCIVSCLRAACLSSQPPSSSTLGLPR